MRKTVFLSIALLLFLLAAYLRTKDLQFARMYTDVGYELEAARVINQKREIPFVGPSIGIDGLFIPPTYLYLISFFYFISAGSVTNMAVIYAVMGVMSIVFLFALFYLLTNRNKTISLIFLAVLVFFDYHVVLSRAIWHPYPTVFFISLSLFLGHTSLKKGSVFLLVVSQWLFFVALSIYPSAIYLAPIIYLNSYYLFKRISLSSVKSFFASILSLSSLFFVTYLPQFIFELQNKFPSFYALLEHNAKPAEITTKLLATHYWRLFEVFYQIFFDYESLCCKIFFIFFVAFLFFINQIIQKQQNMLSKIIDNHYLFLWILLVSYLLMNLNNPHVAHRMDLLSFVFVAFLLIKTDQILLYAKGMMRFFLLLPIAVFLSFFLVNNIPRSFEALLYKSSYSYFTNSRLGEMIISKIKQYNLDRQEVMVLYDYAANENYDLGFLWTTKWQAEPIDHYVNKIFTSENPIIDNYQCTKNYGIYRTIDYFKPNYYFLICNNGMSNFGCLDKFLASMASYPNAGQNHLSIKETFYLTNDFSNIEIFLLAKTD